MRDEFKDIHDRLKSWAKWRIDGIYEHKELGYPKQSAEQMAGLVRGDRNAPLPEWDEEMKTDRAVESLSVSEKQVIFCRYKIPLPLKTIHHLEIPEKKMLKGNVDYYLFWPSDLDQCRQFLKHSPTTFNGILRLAQGKISGLTGNSS